MFGLQGGGFFFRSHRDVHPGLGSPLQSGAEGYAELQGGHGGGRSRRNGLLSAGGAAQPAQLGHLLPVSELLCRWRVQLGSRFHFWSERHLSGRGARVLLYWSSLV